jgi:hypothetical protein
LRVLSKWGVADALGEPQPNKTKGFMLRKQKQLVAGGTAKSIVLAAFLNGIAITMGFSLQLRQLN